ncbi:MAG TPA: HAMP domain-containing sensor histidine kinase [Gemmataceae bacterium]|nr:HAMP domain-containing sensor histidine kinase [Gemmataceae bacterium]
MTEATRSGRFWRYVRGLAAPVLLSTLLVFLLLSALLSRLQGETAYDEAALREWIDESRVFRETLPGLVRDYLEAAAQKDVPADQLSVQIHAIEQQLEALGDPTKMYQGQLPLFPAIYRLELSFPGAPVANGPIIWESGIPRPQHTTQVRTLDHLLLGPNDRRAVLHIEYQLHAYNKRQRDEQAEAARLRWVLGLTGAATALALFWIYLVQRRERAREQARLQTARQITEAQQRILEGELRRQESERLHQAAERKLLEQRLATQIAEQQALELKSQLYASVGIMAGSYAHNIKNLLVRPNDLLSRCLEADGLSAQQDHMLREVRHTLATVTERLQQILRTVHRDPSHAELAPLDLNDLVLDIERTWRDLAQEKWKLSLRVELAPGPLEINGDLSHLQQAVENLLFNARDATFEMRSRLRDRARRHGTLDELSDGPGAASPSHEDVRTALIAAAAWKGVVTVRTRREAELIILEVQDNGIGMTEDVRRQCVQTHFSTKRDNALYEGQNTGMGLGLSFVVTILQHHQATLEIQAAPLQGALFRVRFPRKS